MNNTKGRKRYYKCANEDGKVTLIDAFDTDAGAALALVHFKEKLGEDYIEIEFDEFQALCEVLVRKEGAPSYHYINRKGMGIIDA